MRRTDRFRPGLEAAEPRVLPATAPWSPPSIFLQGEVQVTESDHLVGASRPRTYLLTTTFSGSGRVAPMGPVQAVGSSQLFAPQVRRIGEESGTLILSNSQGRVRIRFFNPSPLPVEFSGPDGTVVDRGAGGSGSPPPQDFIRFVIVGGTGAYRGAKGSGTFRRDPAHVVVGPGPGQAVATTTYHLTQDG